MLAWLALSAFVVLALAVDLRFGTDGTPAMRNALAWAIVWTAAGVGFAGLVLVIDDGAMASQYLAGFLIEKSLSLDNLFVFAVLFSFLGVPPQQRRRILVYGIAGAIVLRALFIVVGVTALDAFHAATYVLGGLLALTAWRIARHGGDVVDPSQSVAMRGLRRVLPISDQLDGSRLTTMEDGSHVGTPLLVALLAVAAFDVMFALDSIPAILAVTRETFIVFAANAFSLLGMVSLYFVLEGLLGRFRYLHLGLAAILAYVAAKLLLVDFWHPPIGLSLGVIVLSLTAAAVASALAERRDQRSGFGAGERARPGRLRTNA